MGDLRFAPPQPASYNNTYAAIKQPPACLQAGNSSSTTYGMSEDCLYLDIFQPANASDSNPTLPVMVWVYGGSFTSGAASIYNGTAIVAQSIQTEKPVIFVAFNYRLGILGFGNGEEIAANGAANLGIRDAIQALTWIQGNIWAWGGDASKVSGPKDLCQCDADGIGDAGWRVRWSYHHLFAVPQSFPKPFPICHHGVWRSVYCSSRPHLGHLATALRPDRQFDWLRQFD